MNLKLRKTIVILIILSAYGGNLGRYIHRAPKRHYCDFRVYHSTAQRFLEKENIYSRPDEEITPFKYSPAFAFATSPLGMVSRKTASIIFFTINFFSLIAILMLSKRMIAKRNLTYPQTVFLYTLTIIFTSRFILQVCDAGQVNLIMTLLVLTGLYLSSRGKEISGSVFLAFSVMFKYMPAIFMPYFFLRKKYKLVILILIFIMVFLILPSLYLGFEKNTQLLKEWLPFISRTSLDKGSWLSFKNQSLHSMVLRYTVKDSLYKDISLKILDFNQGLILSAFICLSLYAFILVPGRSKFNFETDISLLFICLAIFNPNGWMINFVALLFGYMFIIYYLIINRFRDKLVLALLILSFMFCSWASESLVGNNLENLTEELSVVTIGALSLYAALLKIKFSRVKE